VDGEATGDAAGPGLDLGDAAGDATLPAARPGTADAVVCGGPNGVNCGGAALVNPRPPVVASTQ